MFSLAGDVDRYSEFLPWCSDSVILERTETEVLAKIVLAYEGWNTTFTTRNRMAPDHLIEMI
jgi:ribosome-associated toxin RatA of RatAB toxin-antitoxin module